MWLRRRYVVLAVALAVALFVVAANLLGVAPPPPWAPTKIGRNRFSVEPEDAAAEMGCGWIRMPALQSYIEKDQGYDFSLTDAVVRGAQSNGLDILFTIFPTNAEKPSDVEAYKKFVESLVERYDGDGVDDMLGLAYPIKHWEVMNEPDMTPEAIPPEMAEEIPPEIVAFMFKGDARDYFEILKATYEAVKEADPEAKVLIAAPSSLNDRAIELFDEVFSLGGGQYFDIANLHMIAFEKDYSPETDFGVGQYKQLLASHGLGDKPIWITELQLGATSPEGEEKQAEALVKGCVRAFASGVERIRYQPLKVPSPEAPEPYKAAALIDESGRKKPGYYAFKTLVDLIGRFESVEKLEGSCYKFVVEGREVYVVWGDGRLPQELAGEVCVVDVYGSTSKVDASSIAISDKPLFVYKD